MPTTRQQAALRFQMALCSFGAGLQGLWAVGVASALILVFKQVVDETKCHHSLPRQSADLTGSPAAAAVGLAC